MIKASLATIPSRKAECYITITSLIEQVDKLYINFNYKNLPNWLSKIKSKYEHKLKINQLDNTLGDAAKFFPLFHQSPNTNDYWLICDDDIIYPSDYVQTMINKCKKYHNKCIIGLHGIIIDKSNYKSYYKERKMVSHIFQNNPTDKIVNLLGTSSICFNHYFKLSPQDFPIPNMADIHLAIYTQKKQIPMICIQHTSDYCKYQSSMKGKYTIFDTRDNHDHIQTQQLNKIKNWKLFNL